MQKQLKDTKVKKLVKQHKSKFSTKKIEGVELAHYEDKIYIPYQLQSQVISWYHEYLIHPGKT